MGSLSALDIVASLAAIAVGALVQGSVGFGFVLVAGPLVALVEPGAVPATFLILALPMQAWMAVRERHAIDIGGFAQMTLGRVVGTVAGAFVLVVVARDELAGVVGCGIVVAVLISAFAPAFEPGAGARIAAGGVSGLMATVAAVGGPAMALVYQGRSGSELRATLALTFVAGGVLSLVALAVTGHLPPWHFVFAALLAPAELIGLALRGPVIGLLDAGWMRPAVLTFAAAGGLAVVAKALVW